MNRCRKIAISVCVFLTAFNVVACGQAKGDEVVNTEESSARQQESSVQTVEGTDLEIKEDETANADESSVNQQENSMQTVESINLETEEDKTIGAKEANAQTGENIDTEVTTEELLDLFINGSISAISSENSAFYITDLDMDSGEWDSYSIGERVDLDNDGENELIICGPYGGIYLDARNNRVYEFAVGEGDSLVLSYVVYNGSTWIMYSNRMHTGYEAYHMEKFEGADNLVAEMNFQEELVDEDNVEGKEKYTLNGAEISYDEYFELCSKIFATEEITTK
ncbi:hypothetical protein D7V94_20050 [Parablautia intestinalis]|uniref:DUF4652 domain-containing protein n=1 Tax=Parablautia intestinalis TaxID=2320100 RepID=A0A3A9A993_9FIRM|nr:hypothetical protein [Parablautia intestinalis]RKI88039.1 hypothetical protein D7V94_20050 [Parablautia intestinalis]